MKIPFLYYRISQIKARRPKIFHELNMKSPGFLCPSHSPPEMTVMNQSEFIGPELFHSPDKAHCSSH
jgi:hypothetical protein